MLDLQKVKRQLERESCPTHLKHPEVEIRGDKINFSACCETFAKTLTIGLKDLIAIAARDSIDNSIKKIFKKR
jgi:hypothetical protein